MSAILVFPRSQRIKNTRTSAPKSRKGCVVCKARRIKCDEKKPQCTACIKSGHQCQYKPKPELPESSTRRLILPQNTSGLTQARPSQAMKFIDQREVYYFWAYQEEAAQELSGVLKSSPWTRAMLQACHTDPFVLRSVVAIGALNKSIKFAYEASIGPIYLRDAHQELSKRHKEFALATYDKAIRSMQQLRINPNAPASIRKALMACLLFHCIEIYLQSPRSAVIQTRAGYNLLQQWIVNNNHRDLGIASPDPTVIEDELFHELSRLDAQYTQMMGSNDLERHAKRRLEASQTVRNMPSKFTSLDEARIYQELIVRRTIHLIGEIYDRITAMKLEFRHAQTIDSPGDFVDPCFIPKMLLKERDRYIMDIRRWCQAIQPIFETLVASADPRTAAGASLLMIHVLHAEITLSGAVFTEECSFDIFLSHYKEIVSLSRLVSQRSGEISSKDLPTFSLSPGPAWCLYDIATFCRDPILRQDALSLLRDQAEQDQTKYKARLATRAYHLVYQEEKGRREDGTLPESARYRSMWILDHFVGESSSLTFICARRLGYPLGKSYPAKREWKWKTFSKTEAEHVILGDMDEPLSSWPRGVQKPNFLKWEEVHEELLEATARTRLALDLQ